MHVGEPETKAQCGTAGENPNKMCGIIFYKNMFVQRLLS